MDIILLKTLYRKGRIQKVATSARLEFGKKVIRRELKIPAYVVAPKFLIRDPRVLCISP